MALQRELAGLRATPRGVHRSIYEINDNRAIGDRLPHRAPRAIVYRPQLIATRSVIAPLSGHLAESYHAKSHAFEPTEAAR